ncbi:Zinc finger PHD-type [Penicillium cinerascens]|uniref:Zinc finger PHD-type n=1 Tax=Penicillium cinerascens TaxID=70096 RepID=A0A9W9M693_9EURO|nr:Zinc finger PHD-type [Penicillium cinerascens]KAJ5191306.1 Zinc finger PHD-type [Penicillium cinerascens]
MSPRRSSRARTTQPSPALLQHTNSSSSSTSLTRERSTRSNNKNPSPQGSAGPRSQSIDEAENGSRADLPHTRTRQRARDDDDEPPREDDEEDPEDDEEEEVTRCLCGQQEYPGLPLSRREALGRGAIKLEGHPVTDSSETLSDDIGSMFIQCDSCKVWQHGGCVGIMDEETSPDEYFCEECRKDLHRIRDEANGSRSSTYLPVAPVTSPAPSSRASSRETSRRSKDPKARLSEGAANAKRRSTMNSRDAAYDEEELIRRAIEESKHDNQSPDDDTATRRAKRSRSDSESWVFLDPIPQDSKRPRTTSPSPTAVSKESHPVSQPPSDDESKSKAMNGTRRQRANSRSQRDKEPAKDTEDVEPEAPETASRRKERSNRRKGDESEQETGSPTKTAPIEPEPVQASPNTPTPQETTAARPATRKSGRPPARRGGRQGRNQYTNRDVNGTGTGTGTESPRRGQSHEIGADSPRVGYSGINGTQINGGDTGRPSKPRHMHPQRTTMNEMKRRVAGILEFISRMQVEMAVASENASTPTGSNGDRTQGLLLKSMVDQIEHAMPVPSDGESAPDDEPHEKDFKELSSMEMMDVLTRHLLKWQQEFGKFGER